MMEFVIFDEGDGRRFFTVKDIDEKKKPYCACSSPGCDFCHS